MLCFHHFSAVELTIIALTTQPLAIPTSYYICRNNLDTYIYIHMQLCSVFTETRAHDDIIIIAAEEEECVMAKIQNRQNLLRVHLHSHPIPKF